MPVPAKGARRGGADRVGDDIVLSPMDRRIERSRLSPRRVALALGVLAMSVLVASGYQRHGLQRTLTVDAARLSVSTVGHGTFHEYIPLTGSVVPRTTVYLDAIEGGQVTQLLVEEGAVVSAGQPLLALRNTDLQLQVIAAEAHLAEQLNALSQTSLAAEQARQHNQRELLELEHRIDQLERELARLRPLATRGVVTRRETDEVEAELAFRERVREALLEVQRIDEEFRLTQLARMRETLEAANRNLEITRENLDNLVVTAPIAGQLTLLEASLGESKAPGERIGQIDESGAFKVSALVDEFYLLRVAPGQAATFETDGHRHELTVTKVYPDVRNRQFQVDLDFTAEPPRSLRRGQTARLRLEIGPPADALVLANGPFYADTGGQWVFVLDESGQTAERRAVRFGRRNPEGLEVIDGLRAGERVITSGYETLRAFDRIRLRHGGG